jgi:hypothetical protein
MANEEKKPWYKRPLVLVAIGSGFVGLSGLGIWLYKRSQNSGGDANSRTGKTGDDFDSQSGSQPPALPSPDYTKEAPSYSSSTTTSNFPIKKGSRGEFVKNLQNALIQKYGASVLPKYGADGVWGSELTKALTDNKLKTVIDNTTYTDYVTGNFNSQPSTIDPSKTTASSGIVTKVFNSIIPSWVTNPSLKIGWQLFDAAKAKNIDATITLLKQIANVNDYGTASQGFQLRPYQLIPLHRFTLVSGLFDAFSDSQDKKNKIREQLRRMGLVEHVKNSDAANYDSSWTLSGLGSVLKNVRTKMKAIITDGFNIRMEIPPHTLLGRWLSSGNGYTRFRSFDGRTLYIRSNAIQLV